MGQNFVTCPGLLTFGIKVEYVQLILDGMEPVLRHDNTALDTSSPMLP